MSDIDDKIKSEALNWLVSLRGTAERAQGFVLDQAPDALREIVLLGRIESTAGIAFGVSLWMVCLWFVRRLARPDLGDDDQPDVLDVVAFPATIAFFVVGVFAVSLNFHKFMASWMTPRTYALEAITEMIGWRARR